MKSKRQISLASREWKIFKVVRVGNKNYQPRKCAFKSDSKTRQIVASVISFSPRSIYTIFSSLRNIIYAYMPSYHDCVGNRFFFLSLFLVYTLSKSRRRNGGRNLYITQPVRFYTHTNLT